MSTSNTATATRRDGKQKQLYMSFYDDDDDDDEEAPEVSEEERERIRKFREQMLSGESSMGFGSILDDDEKDDDIEDNEEEDESQTPSMSMNKLQDEGSIDELIRLASSSSSTSSSSSSSNGDKKHEWAIPLEAPIGKEGTILEGGVVLVANPAVFCSDFKDQRAKSKSRQSSSKQANANANVSPSLLAKFGLTIPPPAELGADRRADLLPVIILIENGKLMGSQGVLMNRRTGYLIGDLEQQRPPMPGPEEDDSAIASESAGTDSYLPKLGAFMIQPLWFGGTSSGVVATATASTRMNSNKGGGGVTSGGGIDMLHMCDRVMGSRQLTDDGLFWGGDPAQAQEVLNSCKDSKAQSSSSSSSNELYTGFDFKFFVQSTRWLPTQLEKDVRDRTWFVASVSKEVLFKSRDRLGTRRGKPLWTEIMELMGGEYRNVRDQLYEEED